MTRKLPLFIQKDLWLKPYTQQILDRIARAEARESALLQDGSASLADFAQGHQYYGLHREADRWVFREWAPHAQAIFLVGDFNNWQEQNAFELTAIGQGNWELVLPLEAVKHEQYYKMKVYWEGGSGERIPAWTRRVVQDEQTHLFAAQVWEPAVPYDFEVNDFVPTVKPLLIYECHIGMAVEDERVGSFVEFRDEVLPRIAALGYNAIQVMAIQEHPYYGSFGYHVSSFFAVSSRFGTPEELKSLIDRAHELGIAVIMDIVHSHAVKNELEGIGNLDGSHYQYFHDGAKRVHPAWDSLCFDYSKDEVLHFLLSNCRYWLEEFRFDGFRFDGVTSMLYQSHGLNETFMGYADYFNENQDLDAVVYLQLANKLIHHFAPNAVTIAEEMSGMPGLALPITKGGIGFDFRMAMGVPDYWIKLLKEKHDEDWDVSALFWELTNRRADEKTMHYAESHDQAMVGDKTIIFRLIDEKMYWHMMRWDNDLTVARGIALHKMIRLITATTMDGGYLNFMGNEFGHPEWIDFPRDGNGWSHKYARRQWSLVDRPDLKYQFLNRFDREMIHLLRSMKATLNQKIELLCDKQGDQVLAFKRGKWLFVFNFSAERSFTHYGILAPEGKYVPILDSDAADFGGSARVDHAIQHFTQYDALYHPHNKGWLYLYLPARTAQVYVWKK